ncbi:MAG TPA: MBL fold metallo-hydrolase [Humidesulfovibrio sp.]|uniref:MBL fold metallo-hydrolase n=1 Tax=Humidesulfovibrio sp. TaxID=2910988 RepID=UPI002C2D2354|nr:MBL fold metallo-hydrolase [Humidesulfovibrio sp.]HWR03434.1 MBL fold metallo-hydrolase [Humidesulfovibrio sp.]
MHARLLTVCFLLLLLLLPTLALAQSKKPQDVIKTDAGDVTITFLGHGTLMLQWQGKVIHIDPWTAQADYSTLPKADLVLVTHEHRDHLDMGAIEAIRKDGTLFAASLKASASLGGTTVLKNGDSKTFLGIRVDAVPAYNREHMRSPGVPFHPKGEGNGYVLHFGSTRIYVAGDTEVVPEMAALKGVDVAFLPVNLPYTMTADMLVEAAKLMQPKVLYPYHTGDTDLDKLQARLKDVPGVETRIRPMK